VSSELSSRANKERAALILVPLLLLHLVLLSLQIEGPSGTLLFKTWTLTAQAPVVTVFSSTVDGIRKIWHEYIWLAGVRAENEQLQRTVGKLSLLNRAYEQSRLENERLRRLILLSDHLNFQMVGARVVARTPNFLSNILYIDRGSIDGIKVDAPVLSGDGIIGRVILVTRHQSQVQLVTNPDASIGGMLERSRTPGVLTGTGDQLLDLNYISNTEQVTAGDNVLSSGLDGIFPKGIAIGRVVDVRKGQNVFWTIKVKPLMDMIHLEEVSVLLGTKMVPSS
jgi:rod shape-determining protein MreC